MKKRILLVDDDPQIRESLYKVLRSEGYEVVLAANAQESVDKFDPERTDLLLLDLNLPGQSGWDIFERMSFLNPLLPIIIITGRPFQFEMAAAAGVGALIEKPLDIPYLLRSITELLAEPPETRIERLAGMHDYLRFSLPLDETIDQRPMRPDSIEGRPRSPVLVEPKQEKFTRRKHYGRRAC